MKLLPSRLLPVILLTTLVLLSQVSPVQGTGSQVLSSRSSAAASLIDPPPYVNLLDNGDFSNGLASWVPFATPDLNHIYAQVTNGVLEFYKEPQHDGRANQAVLFQWTNQPVRARTPLVAAFDLGNSSSVRKRIAVLIHEDEFSDLYACTFWLPPNAPLRRYAMRTHTNRDWHNPTLAFYAATAWSDGGYYQIDNVTMMYDPMSPTDATICEDALAPTPRGGPDGPDLIVNGGFLSGLEPWAIFHRLTWQLPGHVFEFIWDRDAPPLTDDDCHPIPQFEPAPVIIQRSATAFQAGEILTASFELGNSSPARKRVSLLLHRPDFADLAACSFWLEPDSPLQTYSMRMATTIDWPETAFSVYAATRGSETWIQFDNAELRHTPGRPTAGVECFEPQPPAPDAPALDVTSARVGANEAAATRATSARPGARGGARVEATPQADRFVVNARQLSYLLPPDARALAIEVSADGDSWETVFIAEPSEDWRLVTIDLRGVTGPVAHVRVTAG